MMLRLVFLVERVLPQPLLVFFPVMVHAVFDCLSPAPVIHNTPHQNHSCEERYKYQYIVYHRFVCGRRCLWAATYCLPPFRHVARRWIKHALAVLYCRSYDLRAQLLFGQWEWRFAADYGKRREPWRDGIVNIIY